jgi:hypothetical protein
MKYTFIQMLANEVQKEPWTWKIFKVYFECFTSHVSIPNRISANVKTEWIFIFHNSWCQENIPYVGVSCKTVSSMTAGFILILFGTMSSTSSTKV